MSNTKPCSECEHYDPILRGAQETRMGWCVKKSLYPYRDSPGQVTPAKAQRVNDPDAPAEPHIVSAAGVVPGCTEFAPKKQKPSKADLMAKALGGKR